MPATAWAILFLGLVTSQLCLLGMWLGLGKSHWAFKLAGAACGTATVWAVMVAPRLYWQSDPLVIAVTLVLVTAAGCIALDRWWLDLEQAADGSIDNQAGLRFSLGQLLGATCFYAAVLGLGRLRASTTSESSWVWIIVAVSFALSLIAVPVVALWSALGRERLAVRIMVGVTVSSVHGLLPAAVLKLNWSQVLNFSLCYLICGVLIFASLLVIRSNGCRVTFHVKAIGLTAKNDAGLPTR